MRPNTRHTAAASLTAIHEPLYCELRTANRYRPISSSARTPERIPVHHTAMLIAIAAAKSVALPRRTGAGMTR